AGLSVQFTYATDLFDESTVISFADRFARILEAVTVDPAVPVGDIEVLSGDERAMLTHVDGEGVPTARTLPEILTAAVAVDPDATAVRFDGRSISYRELDEQSSRLARLLIERGIGPEDVVAVAVPRSVESVVAVWAVAKAGAAFMPVDPRYPVDRVLHMVTDSTAVVGITTTTERGDLPDAVFWIAIDDLPLVEGVSGDTVADSDRVRGLLPQHPAYVIYTSGSTGRPKGVVVTHSGLANFAAEQVQRFGLSPSSRTLHFASPSFDASVLEFMLAFAAGSTMVIAPPLVFGGAELSELLAGELVSHAFVTPAALASVDPAGLDELEVVVVGGEACSSELVSRWAPGRRLFNAYGPTEATVASNISDALIPALPVTIGRPIRGVSAFVLDSRLNPVPKGVAGELYLAGDALARGYRGRPELTAERFVANPLGEAGSRLYRTGDVVRWTSGLNLEYVGRSDFQVKVRGFRIELGEIDAAMVAHPSVDFAVTVGRELPSGATALVSYVLPVVDEGIDTAGLLEFVGRTLPSYMVPSAVVVLDEIPLSASGKLDRTALPEPVFEPKVFKAPTTGTEHLIAEVFADVLGLEHVGADESFFALGGDSIVSIQLVSRAKARGVVFSPRDVFERKTVAGLAEVAVLTEDAGDAVVLEELPGGG
ncbi:amino acid adenylation domain-containing protein, partial [Rhodococcus sp. WS4]